ncbi:hypothetical protein RYX36_000946 [Vicia faba]
MKGDYHRYLAEFKSDAERKDVAESTLTAYKDCGLTKQDFDEVITDLDTLGEESYKDNTFIMQLLCDNITLWTSDMEDDSADEIIEAEPKGNDEPQ